MADTKKSEKLIRTDHRDEYGRFLEGFVGLEKRYKNPDDMLTVAESYFNQIQRDKKAPTMAGLALALGFRSRQALLNYKSAPGYEEFHDVIAYLKLKMEQALEERLLDPDNKNIVGVLFNMKNNYGYSDKQEITMDSRTVSLTGFTLVNPNNEHQD